MLQLFIVRRDEIQKLTRLEDLKVDSTAHEVVWIAAVNPTSEEQSALCEFLSVDPKALNGVLMQPAKGRYHRFFDYSALHLPMLLVEPAFLSELTLIVLSNHIVVTIGTHLPQDAVAEVEETLRNYVVTRRPITTSLVAVRIIQEIVERNSGVIQHIETGAMELEGRFAQVDIAALLGEITNIRRLLGDTYNHLLDQRSMTDLMLQHVPRHLQITDDLAVYLNATQTELERQRQTLEYHSRALTDLVALHSVLLANRLNRVIVLLTAITATVTIPSLIANVFGMWNIFNPNPIFTFFGVPIYTWQIEFLVLLPFFIIPLLWLIRKGWIRIKFPAD